MAYRFDDQQQRRQLLNIVDRGTVEQLFVSEQLLIIMEVKFMFFWFEDFFTRISSKTFSKFI
jgi:hypothetical protein